MSQIKLNVSPFETINRKQVFKCCDSVFPEFVGQKFVLIPTEEYVKTPPEPAVKADVWECQSCGAAIGKDCPKCQELWES